MEDLNEYRKNILKILDFAIKDNFSYLNQIKNIKITENIWYSNCFYLKSSFDE